MALRKLLLCGGSAVLVASSAHGETLREALLKSYETNPTLAAQRDNVRAIDENVPLQRASAFPTVQLQTTHTELLKVQANSFLAPDRQLNSQLSVNAPIYEGGRVRNSIAAAETRVEAGRASLRGTEADLFSNVVGAYMDVIRDEAIVALNLQNKSVLEVNLRASKDRFQVGDLTRTDVAQSEARLALATSQLQTAQSRLISSRETYVRLVGTPPGELEPPPALPQLPESPEKAVDVALSDNPVLLAAKKARDAAGLDIKVAQSARLPRLSAFASGGYVNFLGTLGAVPGQTAVQQSTTAQAGLQLTLPLYQGGQPAAQIRQAQARRSQSSEQMIETERGVIAQTRSAYAVWRSSLEVISSAEVAVNANKLALEGVRAENGVGNRTILDILDAEQELLNSQVTLVTAQRDAYVAGFALLAAMGHAEARNLGLGGGALYDPTANYDRVRNNLWDWGNGRNVPATGTSTAQTPAQNAVVSRKLDPLLDTPIDTRGNNASGEQPKR